MPPAPPEVRYSHNQMVAIMDAVEEQGGEHLDEVCSLKKYDFVGPHSKPLVLPGCGKSILFEIPYEYPPKDIRNARIQGTVKVCALEDAVGHWPRFKKAQAA